VLIIRQFLSKHCKIARNGANVDKLPNVIRSLDLKNCTVTAYVAILQVIISTYDCDRRLEQCLVGRPRYQCNLMVAERASFLAAAVGLAKPISDRQILAPISTQTERKAKMRFLSQLAVAVDNKIAAAHDSRVTVRPGRPLMDVHDALSRVAQRRRMMINIAVMHGLM
jgi:hypothetical protein